MTKLTVLPEKGLAVLVGLACVLCCVCTSILPVAASDGDSHWDGGRTVPVHRINLFGEDKEKIVPADPRALPFSAKRTCGMCHNYEKISKGLHFNETDPGVKPGRPSEPWIIVDAKTGTQLPVSNRPWNGVYKPADVGMTNFEFMKRFGRNLPGGKMGCPESDESNARWLYSGSMEINCLGCHSSSPGYSPAEWARQVGRENYRWAATAAAGLGEVAGMASRAKVNWNIYLGLDPDDQQFAVPPSVKYYQHLFNSKNQVRIDIGTQPMDRRCLQCHAVGHPGKKKSAIDCDVHSASGMGCVTCHRNGVGHNIVRGYEAEAKDYPEKKMASVTSCRGCHIGTETTPGGRFGAPIPKHAGIPPIHFEKVSCTSCHSGPMPTKAVRVTTSRANRLGIYGKAHWATDLPYIVGPVFMKGEDGKIAPHRVVWPAFWGQMDGDNVKPLLPKQVENAGKGILGAQKLVTTVLKKMPRPAAGGGQVVFVLNGKAYESNVDGELKPVKVDKVSAIGNWGMIVGNEVVTYIPDFVMEPAHAKHVALPKKPDEPEEPTWDEDAKDDAEKAKRKAATADYEAKMKVYNAEYARVEKLTEERKAILELPKMILEAFKEMAPKGMEPVLELGTKRYFLTEDQYIVVPPAEVKQLKERMENAKKALDAKCEEYGVDNERIFFYFKGTVKKMPRSDKRYAELLKLRKDFEKAMEPFESQNDDALISFGNVTYRRGKSGGMSSEDRGNAETGLVIAWRKGNEVTPVLPKTTLDDVAKTIGTDAVLTESQVGRVLVKLKASGIEKPVYVAKGLLFTADAAGAVSAREHAAAAPYSWAIGHDVRPRSMSLGARANCKACHATDSYFFFGKVEPQGPLATDRAKTKVMHEFEDLDVGFNKLFAASFTGRPMFKCGLGIAAVIIASMLVLFGLLGLKYVATEFVTVGGTDDPTPRFAKAEILVVLGVVVTYVILAISGLGLGLARGGLVGYPLIVHTGIGAAFAGLLTIMVLLKARTAPIKGASAVSSIAFWVLAVCGLVLIVSILLATLPLFGTHGQEMAVFWHKVAAWISIPAVVIYGATCRRK